MQELNLGYEQFLKWRENQQQIGEMRVNEAFSWAAKEYNVYIFANPVNPTSYAHFIRNDVQSKTWQIRERTSREGMQNGFITSSVSGLLPRVLTFDRFFAVRRNGEEILTQEIGEKDEPIEVFCYPDGSYVISDIDLLMISTQERTQEVLQDEQLGEVRSEDKKVIDAINRYFHPRFNLIAHGPANCFSQSKTSHIHYPFTQFSPNGEMGFINTPFLNTLHQLNKKGYLTPLNPRWDL